MKIHNIMEDIVHAQIADVCAIIEQNPAYKGICVCETCRMDVSCYVLNRIKPRYFVSSRGLEREEMFAFEKQQNDADLIAMIFDAFKMIAQNPRPNHGNTSLKTDGFNQIAFFNIPAIIGKILNGQNFAPLTGIDVALYHNGELLKMNSNNWQNPCLVSGQADGNFTFWPAGFPAETAGQNKNFEFLIQAQGEGFEPLSHTFEINLTSEHSATDSISIKNALKLPVLYMFPPEL
ncbi:MAG: late competence development ComFB family protein [Spirochaetaceae bacterium]|jgi:competence protein ComFB|nr:late competence development ComFB family protein [Spirochaetaceae bacterium]GMO18000.1 MAG: late competence development ComFB family protein [Termitinemataceae bacterium]